MAKANPNSPFYWEWGRKYEAEYQLVERCGVMLGKIMGKRNVNFIKVHLNRSTAERFSATAHHSSRECLIEEFKGGLRHGNWAARHGFIYRYFVSDDLVCVFKIEDNDANIYKIKVLRELAGAYCDTEPSRVQMMM